MGSRSLLHSLFAPSKKIDPATILKLYLRDNPLLKYTVERSDKIDDPKFEWWECKLRPYRWYHLLWHRLYLRVLKK